jgi:hypothetical protein
MGKLFVRDAVYGYAVARVARIVPLFLVKQLNIELLFLPS